MLDTRVSALLISVTIVVNLVYATEPMRNEKSHGAESEVGFVIGVGS